MKKVFVMLCAVAATLTPATAFAATSSIQQLLKDSMLFVNKTLLPLLFALAFLFFLVNVVRYFIAHGADEKGREQAKRLAVWGIIAFVLMVSIWGIVNLLVSGFGIDRNNVVCPDYPPGNPCQTGSGPTPIVPSRELSPTTPI
ncbi:hypothetical protein HY416_00895 [Candidatus Kaiserbacteria bacterium]|nr:hypothetical protein [Candidatus Kaiserbacteria bacterium]